MTRKANHIKETETERFRCVRQFGTQGNDYLKSVYRTIMSNACIIIVNDGGRITAKKFMSLTVEEE